MENTFAFWGSDCIVYLDSFVKMGEGKVDAYIDFRLAKDFAIFRSALYYPQTEATYIELRSLKSSKRLIFGCYYKLNLELLKQYEFSIREDSLLIGGSFDLEDMPNPDGNANEMLQAHEPLEPYEMSMINVPQNITISFTTQLNWELFVKDVNQANWNELRAGGKVEVVYDAGAELHAPKVEVESIFNTRRKDLEQSKPLLVVSHWDMDHVHCLKYLTAQDISSCFSKMICVNRLKSLTSSGILTKFMSALGAQNVVCLPLPPRTNGIDMHLWRKCGDVSFYQAERSRNINYCGILMFVKGNSSSANYTGDLRLSQAKNAYQQEITAGINTQKHILVAPHHGGDYGVSFRKYTIPCDSILISVGAGNGYGHPQKDMLSYLNSLGTVERTDFVGDIIKQL